MTVFAPTSSNVVIEQPSLVGSIRADRIADLLILFAQPAGDMNNCRRRCHGLRRVGLTGKFE
jgi:hypothetical protein